MLVPIVPLFLMVFGHEAWRRVCPLSLASQLPGYAGIRRFRSELGRRTGLIRKTQPLIDRNGWLARNSWYVQFGFLFTGICARLLIINSDRYALAAALLFVIGAAMLTGFLWGGKTWCNFFCPANVVQKIYTEPGGILESRPHLSKPSIPQSMCRKSTQNNEISACVACTANCGDIDLQRSYWNGVMDTPRRNVYYMFFGLIIGFYGYYYLYSGSWDYYFSGIWTHEADLLETLLSPGLYIFGEKIFIPKVLAVPLVLSAACAASLTIGRTFEFLYRRARRRSALPSEVLVHHCLTVSAWLSINAFYIFGGRPNILLLPHTSITFVDIVIWSLTTTWLWLTLHKSPSRYQKEGLVVSLLRELKKHATDLGEIFDMKKLSRINRTEVNLLAKILPSFTRQQKIAAYQKVLNEEVTKGTTSNNTVVQLLEDLRNEMGISEEEHNDLLEQMGFLQSRETGSASLSAEEKAMGIAQYKSFLETIISAKLAAGANVAEVLQDESILSSIEILRRSLQISDTDHAAALAEISGYDPNDYTVEQGLDELVRFTALQYCLEGGEITDRIGNSLLSIFLRTLDELKDESCLSVLNQLISIQARSDAAEKAADLASLTSTNISKYLNMSPTTDVEVTWKDVLSPEILGLLDGRYEFDSSGSKTLPTQRYNRRRAILESLNLDSVVATILGLEDDIGKAIGLTLFQYIDVDISKSAARDILSSSSSSLHPMLRLTAENVAIGQVIDADILYSASVTIAAKDGAAPAFKSETVKNYFTIGSAPGNDIVLTNTGVAQYHVALRAEELGFVLVRLDEKPLFLGSKRIQDEAIPIQKKSVVCFGSTSKMSSRIQVDWECNPKAVEVINNNPVVRLGLIALKEEFSHYPIAVLADLALRTFAMRRIKNERLVKDGSTLDTLLIYDGTIRVSDSTDTASQQSGRIFGGGDCFAFSECAPLSVEVDSRSAIVLAVAADQLSETKPQKEEISISKEHCIE
ncbi:FHA domain-containing protein [Brucella sp. NBRC 12950]|uniref:FHA domain-containing protein n=1 Tax=Brucella sp. NBRC 12950 TaxID=2994518 RepID=UPI0025533849|nr:FHA domain-containing protein [Brucella sp. NBRC 12950]